ncbi:MAG TPA: tRNA (guanosine(46)-N7)-methyltransferase TrmB [Alphaproteobacteria bacterium]|nr:tRNA (guanosine(46)-N7)-methyltransferase TrmB [Alphaproteobacteria bacterium]
MSKENIVKDGTLRSFGRLANRMSKQEQSELDTMLDKYSINLEQAQTLKDDSPDTEFLIEVGCGKGEQIIHRAKNNPEKQYIACEVFKNSLAKIAKQIEEHDLKNLKIFYEDARILLENIQEDSIDTVMVLYPDPWPKEKHKKRRIVNQELLDLTYRIIKPEGKLILATDITDYALWMIQHVLNHGKFNCLAKYPNEWSVEPDGWHTTSYEQKARKFGRSSWYLQFAKGELEKQFTKASKAHLERLKKED